MADTLKQALGTAQRFGTFQGQTILLEEFDLNDIADLEAEMGASIDTLNPLDTADARLIIWIALRRADETLTPEEKRECRYKLTPRAAARRIKASQFLSTETITFLSEIMKASGLYTEPASGNEPGDAQELAQE